MDKRRLYGKPLRYPKDWKKRFKLNTEDYHKKSFTQFIANYIKEAEKDFLKPEPLSLKQLPKKPPQVNYDKKTAYPTRPVPVKDEFEKTTAFEKRRKVELEAWENEKRMINENWQLHVKKVDSKNASALEAWKKP